MNEKAKFVQMCCDFYDQHSESDKQWFAQNYDQCDEPHQKNNLCMHKWQFPLFVLRSQQAEIEELYPEKPQAALTNDDLAKIGFFKYSALFTLGNTMRFDLGRDRYLKAICVGTRNEMVFLCADEDEPCSDLICIHNRNYDGPLTIERIKSFIDWFVRPMSSKSLTQNNSFNFLQESFFPQAILDAERKCGANHG